MAAVLDDDGSVERIPRRSPRVSGPFDGRRVGALTVELRIHNLSVGGCLIQSFHDVPLGRRMTLELDLPEEGSVTLMAETVHTQADFGFAVKFVDVSEEARQQLERAIERLLKKSRPAS